MKKVQLSFKTLCWVIVKAVAIFIVTMAVLGVLGMFCWNNLTSLTELPEVTFNQAFTVAVLARTLRVAFG